MNTAVWIEEQLEEQHEEGLWHQITFEVDGVNYNSLGQYLVAEKARLFEDYQSLKRILQTTDCEILQQIGEHILYYDEGIWLTYYNDFLVKGIYEKIKAMRRV